MTEQYWVGEFYVDLSRNQITQQAQSQSIPPKALAVLTCLAKRANTVVSQDEILSEVWPDTVVTPNTLQRSIAQLRKALGEGSHSYIKTHAKKGYSLEVEVNWQVQPPSQETLAAAPSPDNSSASETSNSEPTQSSNLGSSRLVTQPALITALILLIIVAVVSFYYPQTSPLSLQVTEFRALTATDNKEYNGIYSPDGNYVIFQRYSEDICRNNHILARDSASQREVQLTREMGAYGSQSLSPDGKTLTFIESNECDQPVTQRLCYNLMSIDFEKALQEPQTPTVLVECRNSRIARPLWLDNEHIALAQEFSNRLKLISYAVADSTTRVIYENDDSNIVHFDYSPQDDLIAVTSVQGDGQLYIEMLQPTGELVSRNEVSPIPGIEGNRYIYPNFTPYPGLLIFSTGRQLFTLSYDGEISNISLPQGTAMSTPIFHPTEERMLVIQGHYDSDIAKLSLSTAPLLTDSVSEQVTDSVSEQVTDSVSEQAIVEGEYDDIIDRSTQGEDSAQFQPNGNLIAFQSSRTGRAQVWVSDGQDSRQISSFPLDTYLNGMDWAQDGQSLLLNANQTLVQIALDGTMTAIHLDYPVEALLQWNSQDNRALAKVLIDGVVQLVEISLTSHEIEILSERKVSWAARTDDGRLIYTDQMERFWQSGALEDQLIDGLANQGSDQRFIIRDGLVYGINEDGQLWSYNLDTEVFTIIRQMPERIDYLDDVSETDVLVTVRVAAKKEVVELFYTD
ncbi:MAG: winged helix-turn-helix domain-containing protein [Pseudomonadales bacterium]